jgi:hypothetical protein
MTAQVDQGMEGLKEIFELLGKAKDMRLNIALFVVSLGLLWVERTFEIPLSTVLSGILQILVFITAVVIVARMIGWIYEKLEARKSQKRDMKKQILARELAESAAVANSAKIELAIQSLDIFQLLIIQELKKANTVSVQKGAHLFTLKNLGIVRAVAIGERRESVQFTDLARDRCNEEFWAAFNATKKRAALRFFSGLELKELKAFTEFTERDLVNTAINNGRSLVQSSAGAVLRKYSDSVIFQQPQSGYKFEIDSSAKEALIELKL